MKVLVTGASGFLGQRLVPQLIEGGNELLLISRNSGPNQFVGAKWIVGDIASAGEVMAGIENFEPEAVYHLAWEGIPDFSEKLCRKNLVNSLNFLAPILNLSSVNRLTLSGSCWEYGAVDGACREGDQTQPNNWFTWAKETLRSYLERACSDGNVKLFWMRVFFVYGPGQRSSSLIPTVAGSLRQNKKPDIRSPFSRNDFIYVDDVIDGFVKTLSSDAPSGIYNLGSGQDQAVIDVVRCIEKELSGVASFTSSIESESNKSDEHFPPFFADLRKSKDVLGWQPATELADGIKNTLDHLGR